MSKKLKGFLKISPSLKEEILSKILTPNSHIPTIAKEYNLSKTTLYGWRIDYLKQSEQPLLNSPHKFIELSPPSISEYRDEIKSQSKLSSIELRIKDVFLSIDGEISSSSLQKILSILLEESC